MTTSLDAIETTGHLTMPESYRSHSVSACSDEMHATREVYASFSTGTAERRLNAFDTCRSRAWFVRHKETGDIRVAAKSCKLRWCPLCAKKRQWFLVEQVRPWAESVSRLKFLTLTLKHSDAPLHQQIDNLYTFFSKFRRLKYLKDRLHGGVWFFQIKKSKKSGQWHPHLHCLIDAEFMEQSKLSQLWQRTTLGSSIVDIRAAGSPDKVAEYVGRYSARPSNLAELSLPDRVEVVEALHGRRLMGTWGNAKEVTLKMEKPADASMWLHVGHWSTVQALLSTDDHARKIFNAWRKSEPLEPGISMIHVEKDMYDVHEYEPVEPVENKQLFLEFTGVLD